MSSVLFLKTFWKYPNKEIDIYKQEVGVGVEEVIEFNTQKSALGL